MFFQDPFKLIPVTSIAELSDKLTRNEIMSSNEVRSLLGLKPSKNPKADELRNKNMPNQQIGPFEITPSDDMAENTIEGEIQNGT